MIVHVVLFRPRADLPESARATLARAFADALREIPAVRRARVGRRVTHGRGYESMMRANYSHIAMLEFDDLDGLKTYLEHPAHQELGTRFYETFEEGLIYDFELDEVTGSAGDVERRFADLA
jgi:hypothetical protein